MNENINNYNKKIKFCCNPIVEMTASLHALSAPSHHLNCTEWSKNTNKRIFSKMSDDINFFSDNYNQWSFIMDIVSSNVFCSEDSVEDVFKRINDMDIIEFSYLFLGGDIIDRERVKLLLKAPDKLNYTSEIELQKYFSKQSLSYFLNNPYKIKNKMLNVLKQYWYYFFREEWSKLERHLNKYMKEKYFESISYSQMKYLTKLYDNLLFFDEIMLCKLQKSEIKIDKSIIEDIVIFPSLFTSPHFMMNRYKNTLQVYLNIRCNIFLTKDLTEDLFYPLKAISNETRLKILKNLYTGKKTTKELSEDLGYSPGTISEHLKILRKAELIRSEKVKNNIYNNICEEKLFKVFNRIINYIYSQ